MALTSALVIPTAIAVKFEFSDWLFAEAIEPSSLALLWASTLKSVDLMVAPEATVTFASDWSLTQSAPIPNGVLNCTPGLGNCFAIPALVVFSAVKVTLVLASIFAPLLILT